MPFSGTASCTEAEWTEVFETVLKLGIENAGLDYVCRRSAATRGNIVAQIIKDLNDAYVVVADLTDQNPNVFYELGVRHALKNRTILLAQNRKHIPFDLGGYANHIYTWRTDEGKANLELKLKELLQDIDSQPDRLDNPVSDFLGVTTASTEADIPASMPPPQTTQAQPLIGEGAEEGDAVALARKLSEQGPRRLIEVLHKTLNAVETVFRPLMNSSPAVAAPMREEQIYDACLPFVEQFEPHVIKLRSLS